MSIVPRCTHCQYKRFVRTLHVLWPLFWVFCLPIAYYRAIIIGASHRVGHLVCLSQYFTPIAQYWLILRTGSVFFGQLQQVNKRGNTFCIMGVTFLILIWSTFLSLYTKNKAKVWNQPIYIGTTSGCSVLTSEVSRVSACAKSNNRFYLF